MASFLTGEPKFVLFDFLKKRIGLSWSEDLRVIGRIEDGVLIGAVGFNNITGSSCHMHFAGDAKGWLSRRVLRESFTFAFETLQCKVVYGLVSSGNEEALVLDRRIGFTDVVFLKDAHPEGGTHLLEMRKEDCRWLRKD